MGSIGRRASSGNRIIGGLCSLSGRVDPRRGSLGVCCRLRILILGILWCPRSIARRCLWRLCIRVTLMGAAAIMSLAQSPTYSDWPS